MKYVITAFLLGIVWGSWSCHVTSSDPPLLERQSYTFAGANRCDTSSNTGISISVAYFRLKDNSEEAQKINDSLQALTINSLVTWLDSATIASSPNARTNLASAAALLASDYETVRKDMGNLEGCWELETKADTLHATPRTLTVKVETYAYTGGAHPNANLSFYTFDRGTGQQLTLTDMITDTTALLGVVERVFRQQQGLLPQTNLEEHGYFLRDGHFFLPANIGMGQKGMVFYYNPYELAAYAVGPIQVVVPYEQLSGIVRDKWL